MNEGEAVAGLGSAPRFRHWHADAARSSRVGGGEQSDARGRT